MHALRKALSRKRIFISGRKKNKQRSRPSDATIHIRYQLAHYFHTVSLMVFHLSFRPSSRADVSSSVCSDGCGDSVAVWCGNSSLVIPRVGELCDEQDYHIMSSLGNPARSKWSNLYSSMFSSPILPPPSLLHHNMQLKVKTQSLSAEAENSQPDLRLVTSSRNKARRTGKPWDSLWFPFTVFSFIDQEHKSHKN